MYNNRIDFSKNFLYENSKTKDDKQSVKPIKWGFKKKHLEKIHLLHFPNDYKSIFEKGYNNSFDHVDSNTNQQLLLQHKN